MDALVHAVTALVSRLGSVASGANPLAVWGTALQSGATQGSFAATIGSLLSTIARQVGTATTMTIRACLAIVRAVLTKAMPSIATLWWLSIAFVVLACVSIAISAHLRDSAAAFSPQAIGLIFVKGVFYDVPKYLLTKAYELATPAIGKLRDYLWPKRDTLEHLKTEVPARGSLAALTAEESKSDLFVNFKTEVEGRIQRLRATIERGDKMKAVRMFCNNIREHFRGIKAECWYGEDAIHEFYFSGAWNFYKAFQKLNLEKEAKAMNVLGTQLLAKLCRVTTKPDLNKWAFCVVSEFIDKPSNANPMQRATSLMVAGMEFRESERAYREAVRDWLSTPGQQSLGDYLSTKLSDHILWTLDLKTAQAVPTYMHTSQTWRIIHAILQVLVSESDASIS